MAPPSSPEHHWYTPAECAALLEGVKHGTTWRAACPAHQGDNRDALSIKEGRDHDGHPMTLLYCFAHRCTIEDICAAMGLEVRNLFAIHPAYAKSTRHAPRAKSPRIDRLKTMTDPTPDDIAQIMLEEMIVSDPAFIEQCAPARQELWRLVHGRPKAHAAFTRALQAAQINVVLFWQSLTHEMNG